ncbi:MAG TPA: histidine kinase dimerization/phospho-acceptor domain-containing protein [Candidatus Sulfopaludibacter sp.]|nr:histidine kinase dimerization/phospho-acceptor domain-containing protein [Candidatus Sulfopaludibacter sp.]
MVLPGNEISEPEKTEILIGNDNIIKKTLETFSWIEESLDGSIDKDGPALNVLYEPIWTGYISLKKRGIKLRGVTEVTVYNIQYCKKLMEVSGLRHLDGVRTNFAIADGKAVMLHGVSQETDPLSHAIVTSVKGIVDAQQYMFENLWNKAIPAEQKIREIEQGIKPDIIETITDPIRIQNLYQKLVKSAVTEIMLIIPTINAIYRQIKIGILHLLKEVTTKHSNNNNNELNIRILTSSINDYHIAEQQKIKIFLDSFHTQIRYIETDSTTKSTIIIIDRKESLVIELKDDSKDTFSESIGFATYSNSRATVLSYTSIFESFWKQSDLVKKLKESKELQKDFVHIAAHELKNPIQPILGLSGILMKYKPDENEFYNIVKTINRNAKKLNQLTSDILDVTKIETNNLNLNKELFNLSDLISDLIDDYKDQLDNENVKLTSYFICQINSMKKKKTEKKTNVIYRYLQTELG